VGGLSKVNNPPLKALIFRWIHNSRSIPRSHHNRSIDSRHHVPKYQPQIDKSIIGAIGKGNHVTQNILPQPGQPAPYLLPPDIADFTGRADYLAELEGLLTQGKIAAIALTQ
jgi:hypothetical protein